MLGRGEISAKTVKHWDKESKGMKVADYTGSATRLQKKMRELKTKELRETPKKYIRKMVTRSKSGLERLMSKKAFLSGFNKLSAGRLAKELAKRLGSTPKKLSKGIGGKPDPGVALDEAIMTAKGALQNPTQKYLGGRMHQKGYFQKPK